MNSLGDQLWKTSQLWVRRIIDLCIVKTNVLRGNPVEQRPMLNETSRVSQYASLKW
jgi:hypothetical protein